MESPHPICRTCGVQVHESVHDPAVCRICTDERQYVGWDGQRWTTLPEMARADHHNLVDQDEVPGLWRVVTEPRFAIGQRAFVVPGEGGNLLWDCVTYLDSDTVDAVNALGGLAAIAISHPHYYSTMIDWSRAFGDIPVYVHGSDREWVCRDDGNVRYWEGDTHEVLPGRTLLNTGVHFAGGTVLHWAEGVNGRGAVCSGDIMQVVMDRRYVSFMYSYPNLIPAHPDAVRRTVSMLEPYAFDAVYGAFVGRVIETDGKAAVRRSAERYLEHLGLDL